MNGNPASIHHSSRVVLEGVPRAGYDVHMCPFPGSLVACLEYLGDPCDYDYLMGVTGAAFRRFWNRDDGGNVDLSYLGDEPFRRVFGALGYEWRAVPAEKEAMFQAVVESVDCGVPAISFGIIGPPEAGVVAGYDEDGQVLYGWSYFQEQREHYYEKSDWFETMDENAGKGLIVIGHKRPTRPTDRVVFIASLEWAVDLERTARRPGRPEHVAGLAAYDAWAAALEVDADYPPDDPGVLDVRCMVYSDQVVMLKERQSAARYLRQMVRTAPEVAGHLNAAAAFYDQAGGLASTLWPWGGTTHHAAQQGLTDEEMRRELAGHVRAARAKEAQAVEHLEHALAELR